MNDNLSVLIQRGSDTAKAGFSNEKDVVNKFNDWKNDVDAKSWLQLMGYNLDEIEKIEAIQITGSHKADVQVKIKIYMKNLIANENISIKLVSNPTGFNQIDKRWVKKYEEIWAIPQDVAEILKRFTGELPPTHSVRDNRRMYLNEMNEMDQQKITNFFEKNKILVVTEILKGTDALAADWMLIYLKYSKVWSLLHMSVVMNFYGDGGVTVTEKGNLLIGKIGMQRKGGDNGRPTANMLQFKINPAKIIESAT